MTLYTTVPSLVEVIGVIDHIAPAVEDPHFKLVRIHADRYGEERFILAIAIRCKRIRNIDRSIRPDTNFSCCIIHASVRTCYCQQYLETICSSVSEGRILQRG